MKKGVYRHQSNNQKAADELDICDLVTDENGHQTLSVRTTGRNFSELYFEPDVIEGDPTPPEDEPAPEPAPELTPEPTPEPDPAPSGSLDALMNATGGETIALEAGTYPSLTLRNKQFSSKVTLLADGTVFKSMMIENVVNLEIIGATFDYTFNTKTNNALFKPFVIMDTTSVTLKQSKFIGDVDPATNRGHGIGLRAERCVDFTFEENEIETFNKGAQFAEMKNLIVRGNKIRNLRHDGFNFIDIDGALIEGNTLTDFAALPNSGDHRDMMQFWVKEGTLNRGITIRGNKFWIGDGSFTQSILMNNGRYQDILIEDNDIDNGQHWGIGLGRCDNGVIRNNRLNANPGDADAPDNRRDDRHQKGVSVPKIDLTPGSTGIVVDGNTFSGAAFFTAPRITDIGAGMDIGNNPGSNV